MGNCFAPQQQSVSYAEKMFNKFGLKRHLPDESVWENEFERDIFMAINLCRFKPLLFVEIVERVKQTCPLVADSKNHVELVLKLFKNLRLPMLVYDKIAFDAVRMNNSVQCGPEAS
jgi:hypothetical protein